jgi:hypothetical protein
MCDKKKHFILMFVKFLQFLKLLSAEDIVWIMDFSLLDNMDSQQLIVNTTAEWMANLCN